MPESISNEPRPEPPKAASRSDPDVKHGGHAWIWVVVLIVIGIVAVIFFRHRSQSQTSKRNAAAGPPAPMVTTVTSRKGDIGIYVNALGIVTPLYTVAVSSRVDGQITKVSYQEGQMVKQGDPLLDIDSGPFQAALLQAKGQLARDQASLENAKIDLERYQQAYASNAIPQQQLATQSATVHQDEGTVLLDEGTLSNAQVQLNYTHITAPIDGRVGLRLLDPGNVVHSANSNALVVITKLQPITVIFTVAEDYLGQIQQQIQQGKTMRVDAYDRTLQKKLATGTLETLDNEIDTSTGTVKLRAVFTNEDSSLFPNQFVNARLLVETLQDATLVPNAVIQRDTQGAFVYVLNSDQTVSTNPVVIKAPVPPLVADSDNSAVDGLAPDAVLVSDNFNKLTDGMKVQVRKPGTGGHGGGEEQNTNAEPNATGQQQQRQQQ